MLLMSSLLVHVSTSSPPSAYMRIRPLNLQRSRGHPYALHRSIARHLAVWLRRLAKPLATINTLWILTTCLFQFTNVFDRCYCNSSVFGRGESAFSTILKDLASDSGILLPMRNAWVGGVCLAGGSAFLFVGFVNVFVNPPLPES
jgi:hypothetical protein